jgi:hypothetical protein
MPESCLKTFDFCKVSHILSIMDIPPDIDLAESKKSFFNRAAWVSLLSPFITFGMIVVYDIIVKYPTQEVSGYCVKGAFVASVISLILGIVSLFGIPRHGARLIAWKAVIGIIASLVMGFLSLVGIVFNSLGHM